MIRSTLRRAKARAGQLADDFEVGKNIKRTKNVATLWRRSKLDVGSTPVEVVHEENKWRLLRYRRSEPAKYATPVLMVPSLINRHYVLDLAPGRSFVEYLVKQGHDVFMIDWGTPSSEDRFLSFDTITDTYLGRAIRIAAESSPSGKTHVLGYCLGGTLAVIHAAARPHRIASLLALAAPVRFDADGLLNKWMSMEGFEIDALVGGTGNVPWQLMQFAFHMLRPTMSLSKAAHVIDRAWDDEFLDGFLALETWGNDNVSFPGTAYKTYVERLYRSDELIKGTFELSGEPVKLANIECPTLVISFAHDNIVPAESASALVEEIGSKDKIHLHLNGGHVGAVVSRRASTDLWPKMSEFWTARDSVDSGNAPRSKRHDSKEARPTPPRRRRPKGTAVDRVAD